MKKSAYNLGCRISHTFEDSFDAENIQFRNYPDRLLCPKSLAEVASKSTICRDQIHHISHLKI